MSELTLPPEVAALLEPISREESEDADPEMTASFIGLEAEMTKMGDINYPQCVTWAQDILKNECKHLRAAGWLTLAWLNTEGLAGYRNGLFVISELLNRFSGDMHPQKPAQQSKAIQYLNTEKRFQTALNQLQPSDEEAVLLADIYGLFEQINKKSSELLSGSALDLSNIMKFVQEKSGAKPAESTGDGKKKETEASPDSREKQKEEGAKEDKDTGKKATAEAEKTEQVPAQPAESEEKKDGAEAAAEQPSAEETFELPDDVADLLDDISSTTPTGEDVENSENQDTMVVYMSLETEMRKYSDNDYPQCLKLGREILQTKSKHLRVAVWLLIAWFRSEKIAGFRKGILLLLELLKKYGKQLFPEADAQKSKVLQLLNSDTRIKFLEKIKPDTTNAADLVEIGKIFTQLSEQCQKLLPENPPKLNAIAEIIEESSKTAQGILDKVSGKGAPAAATPGKPAQTAAPTATGTTRPSASPGISTAAPAPSPGEQIQDISSDKDAMIAIKKSLLFFFEEEGKEGKNRKLPDDPAIYGLSRIYRWGKLKLPVSQDNITQIEQPNEQKQMYLQKLISSEDYDTLIPELETNFLNREEFPYWFDAQRYLVQALEKKGGKFQEAVQEVKLHLARLINKYPSMPKLLFKDKKTPFAGPETLTWLDEEVKSAFGGGEAREKILPPIMGEDYAPINKEYEKACEELPENFEKNAKAMQTAIAGDTRPKGRFLRLLNLANYCYLARKYSIAKVLFNQLMDQIDKYNIIEWERSLCVSVWQSTYLNNEKLLANNPPAQQKQSIETQQNELFDRIGKYDSVLALNLSSQQQNKGE
jgi:type VI secretion system protein VasJ